MDVFDLNVTRQQRRFRKLPPRPKSHKPEIENLETLVIATVENQTGIRPQKALPRNSRFYPKCDSSEVAILKISLSKSRKAKNGNLDNLVIASGENHTEIPSPSATHQNGRFDQKCGKSKVAILKISFAKSRRNAKLKFRHHRNCGGGK